MNEISNHSKLSIILSYITILRPINGIVAGFAAVFGIVLSGPQELDYFTLLLVIISATLVSSHAMIFNDIADREEDKINAPHRPLPSKKISVNTAKIYGIIIGALGLLCALFIDILNKLPGISLITAIIFGGTLLLYDFKLKKLGFLGNVVIGLNVVAVFAYGTLHTYLIWGGSYPWLPLFLGLGAGMGNLGREVIKGLPDIEGDRKAGNNTLAVKYGPKVTAIIGSLFLWGLCTFGIITIIWGNLYLISQIFGIVIVLIGVFLAIRILFDQSPKWAYTTKEILLLIFLAYLLVFIIDATIKIIIS